MYPELTVPLLVLVGAAGAVLLVLLVRAPVLRRLALRQIARRPSESALVVLGSVLGTAIIVGSLVVGDTLGFSVRQVAYHTLGPVDERVVSTSAYLGDQVADKVEQGLEGRPDVDGVLSAVVQQTAAVHQRGDQGLAEPRVLAFDVDFAAAAAFGAAGGPSGLSGATPGPGRVVVNTELAESLKVGAGDRVQLYLSGVPRVFVVDRVVPADGLAGTGFGSSQNRNAFLPVGTLAGARSTETRWVTWVSNRGGTESGSDLTAAVTARLRTALGALDQQVVVATPKRDVLRQAEITGDSLGALFLMIGSFSIIAGALLLVNVFVMLAEERKGQLGMLRAAGLKRSRLVAAFTLEGAAYAAVAAVVGVVLGIGVGRGVAFVAARIFSTFSLDSNALDVTFDVSATSLVNGAAMGLVISLGTVLLTSLRISRFNIIAAIRDLETQRAHAHSRRRLVLSLGGTVVLGLLSVPAVATSSPVATFVLPALAAVCAVPLLSRAWGSRAAITAVSGGVLAWTMLVSVVRPGVFDTPSMVIYVVLGTQLAFSGVVLLSQNQDVLLRAVRRLVDRPTDNALAGRLALAYPLAKRFRTGATLIMYSLITLVLVLLIEIGGVMMHGIDDQVAKGTAGYGIRLDFAPGPVVDELRLPPYQQDVAAVIPLVSAPASSTDPGERTTEPLSTIVVGVPAGSMWSMPFDSRLPGLATDAAVWDALVNHSEYVVLDAFFGATGGPPGSVYEPGDTLSLTDPRTGRSEQKVIAGILSNAVMFYSPNAPAAFPLVADATSVERQFLGATVSSAFLKARQGVELKALATELQSDYLSSGLVATPMPAAVRKLFEANVAFFRLMEGFLALGLLVGITGLGVVMVRSVRERRRSIGILRALGFGSRTIERSFLMESAFVAVEGAALGALLGLLTTWLLYQRSAMFASLQSGFPVLWPTIVGLVSVTVVASLLATFGPARRAARILPAVATRVGT